MSIYDLYQDISKYGDLPAEYVEKQLHSIPKTDSINRIDYILKEAKNKVVLEMGASGQTSKLLPSITKEYYGIDIMPNSDIKNYYQIDFDKADKLPEIKNLELVIAGEIIEHLSNAGHFLELLHSYKVPIILTTPNAHSSGSNKFLLQSIENVNKEHVAWYSYHTLKVLIERHKYELIQWFWYNGPPIFAEGLVFKMKAV